MVNGLFGDRTPNLVDVKALLDEMSREWLRHDELALLEVQIDAVVGVSGTFWYTELQLLPGTPLLPVATPNPLPGGLEVNDADGQPIGTMLVWLEGGRISCLEFGSWEMASIDHYPQVSEAQRILLGDPPEYNQLGLKT